MSMLRTLTLAAAFAAAAIAQSPLTTNYIGGTSLAAGATVYFDLAVAVPVIVGQIDVNSVSAATTAGTLEIRYCSGTYVGNDVNPSAWTLAASGPVVAAGPGLPTVCTLTPFALPPGNYGVAITHIGIAPNYGIGNGTNQTYTTAEMTMQCGGTATGAVGTAICCTPRVFNGSIYYTVGGGGGTVAQRTSYGAGCYTRAASVYENFATSAAFDLANSGITFLFTGAGYTLLPGITAYVPPSATATALTLTDDSETAVTLSAPFVYPGATTSSLTVCSNGFVSVATGNGTAYTPAAATHLAAAQTAWRNWHDYNPAAAGGGQIKFEEANGVAYITWDGVYDYGGTSTANANTFQFQFELATGNVHLVFQTISALGNGRLVGYSPGGPSIDLGNTDLSAVLPTTISIGAVDQQPLSLTTSARPLIGTTFNLVTGNATGSNLGVNFLSFGQIPAPGLDLGILGAPGCAALVDVGTAVGNLIGNIGLPGVSLSVAFPLPNSTAILGQRVYSQSLWLDATQNAFGALTSNGIDLLIGNV
jgi:hypothetical protein